MVELLVAFVLYESDASWPWWVVYGVFIVMELLGVLIAALENRE